MDIKLTPVRTFDYSIAYAIANDPVVLNEFTEDDTLEFFPDVINQYWITLYTEEGDLAGCYMFSTVSKRTIDIHAFILPEYRKKYGRISGPSAIKWALENLDWDKMITNIPATRKNVFHYTKVVGFREEGFNRKSFLKNGKLHGIYCLGATKEELEEALGV